MESRQNVEKERKKKKREGKREVRAIENQYESKDDDVLLLSLGRLFYADPLVATSFSSIGREERRVLDGGTENESVTPRSSLTLIS